MAGGLLGPATSLLNGWLIIPELNAANVAVIALSSTFILSGSNEASGAANTAYSKFAPKDGKGTVGSRLGMFIIYFAACVASVAGLALVLPDNTWGQGLAALGGAALQNRSVLVALMMTVHFFKRELEVLFVHKYSGSASLPTCIGIGFFYAYVAAAFIWQTALLPQDLFNGVQHVELPGGVSVPLPVLVGGTLWLVGVLGNAYHHACLANLRKDGSSGYKLPQGGLFELVVAPHYLFEILGWWGAAIAAQHVFGFVAAAGFTSYLAGRSVATRKWYAQKMDDFPKNRKCMVPYLF